MMMILSLALILTSTFSGDTPSLSAERQCQSSLTDANSRCNICADQAGCDYECNPGEHDGEPCTSQLAFMNSKARACEIVCAAAGKADASGESQESAIAATEDCSACVAAFPCSALEAEQFDLAAITPAECTTDSCVTVAINGCLSVPQNDETAIADETVDADETAVGGLKTCTGRRYKVTRYNGGCYKYYANGRSSFERSGSMCCAKMIPDSHRCSSYRQKNSIPSRYKWISSGRCPGDPPLFPCPFYNQCGSNCIKALRCRSSESQSSSYSVLESNPLVNGLAMIGLVSIGVLIGLKCARGDDYKEMVEGTDV